MPHGKAIDRSPDENGRRIDGEAEAKAGDHDLGGGNHETPRVPHPLAQWDRRQRPTAHRERIQRGEPADEILVVAQIDEIQVVDEEDDRVAEGRAHLVREDEPHADVESTHPTDVLAHSLAPTTRWVDTAPAR